MAEHSQRCLIEEILQHPFSRRAPEEQMFLVKSAVPRPGMEKLKSSYKRKGQVMTRSFHKSSYDNKWLCGSDKLNKLFCWPCLLFRNTNDKGVWSKNGYDDLNHLSLSMKTHASSKDHINSAFALSTFGKMRIDEALDHGREVARTRYNDEVTKNRNAMRTLVDITCLLGSHGLAFRGHDEKADSANRGNYKDFCSVIAAKDPTFREFLNSKVFSGTSGGIQNELIECVQDQMMQIIKQEVREAEFVSMMVDESTDSARLSQLSCALRYVKSDGTPVERFVGLFDVSSDKSASALTDEVCRIAVSFGLTADTFIAQTYDGCPTMSGEKNGVQRMVKQRFPKAGFIHCRAHVLNLVLLHSCANHKKTSRFFNTLSSLAAFFTQSPKRCHKLAEFMSTKLPNVCKTKWSYNSRMIKIVDMNYTEICACLLEIFMGDEFDGESCTQARGLHGFLLEFNNIFLLKTFAEIFPHTDTLYNLLQQKELDVVECMRNIETCKSAIRDLMNEHHFNRLFAEAKDIAGGENPDRTKSNALFNAVLDKVLDEMDKRFKELKNYEFIGLLNHENFVNYSTAFPSRLVKQLVEQHSFDEAKLCNELKVLYSRPEFKGLNVRKIISLLIETNMSETFSESLRLAKLILAIPSTTASVERTFSVLRRLKNYLRSTMGQPRLFGLMLMAVEAELLKSLSSNPKFYDDVINAFAMKTERRINLLYK